MAVDFPPRAAVRTRWRRELLITLVVMGLSLLFMVSLVFAQDGTPVGPDSLVPWHLVRLDLILPGLALLLLGIWASEYLHRNGPPAEETDKDRDGRVTPPRGRWS